MNSLTNRIASLAMLALASLPAAALATAAHAQTTVKIADLNLLSAEGIATFSQRADYAARDYCSVERSLSAMAACRVAVKAELHEKADAIREAKLARATTSLAAR